MRRAITGPDLFDGFQRHSDSALLICDGRVEHIVPLGKVPPDYALERIDAKLIAPGFVDLQVNGGGGILLNDAPTVETIRTIIAAHARFGTTALLPTLITDTRAAMQAAIEAVRQAKAQGVAGCLGLHLEGPFLAPARKGAHLAALMGPIGQADRDMLSASGIAPLLLTVATEQVTPDDIAALTKAGIHISIGHSDASLASALRAADSGARFVTHLYNAMSPLTHRSPGLVGAAMEDGRFSVGLIADGHHVDPAAIRIALRAKTGPGRIFLVTDAMSTVGSDIQSFRLNNRLILRGEGRLQLEDGTLAGADLDMAGMVRFMHKVVGVSLEEALRMAALYPAEAIGVAADHGSLRPGCRADFVVLDEGLQPVATYFQGVRGA
jgi:N-acetylglucosamine-6-phosphate deacetylase